MMSNNGYMNSPASFLLKPIFFILLCLGSLYIVPAAQGKNLPIAADGILNLKGWDLNKDGTIKLSGQWKFYWNQHIPPKQIHKQNLSSYSGLINIPGAWNGYPAGNKKISGTGYATYALEVLFDREQPPLALKFFNVATCYTLYANGRKIASSGFPGKTPGSTIPSYRPMVVELGNHLTRLDIVIHVSNFNHWQGGIREPILMGSVKKIRALRQRKLIFISILLGSIATMGIYHLVLFGFRPKDRSTLYFGIFCLLISIRLLFTGERIITLMFPLISYEWMLKSIYISLYLGVSLFTMYVHLIFPDEFSDKMTNLAKIFGFSFASFVLLMPTKICSYSMPVFQIFTLLLLIYGVKVTFQVILNKRHGGPIFAVGMLILFFSAANDILYTRQIISTGLFFPVGMLLFLFFQTVLISRKFSTAFSMVEEQRINLLKTNIERKNELIQRKQIQTELEASEKRFSDLLNSITDLIYTQDTEGRFTSANPAMCNLLGYDINDLLGQSAANFMKSEHKSGFKTKFLDVVKKQGYHGGIGCYFKKNKEKIYIEYKCFWVKSPDGNPYISGIGKDVTEKIVSKKKLETLQKQIIQSQKMEAIGTLAGGIAHDFNNILSGIFGYAQLADAHLNDPEKAGKDIHNLLKSAQRASDVVRQILTFSRQSEYEKRPLNVAVLLNETLKLLRSSIPSHIEIKENISSKAVIMADSTQIHQVIMNLCTNAYQAMNEKGGILTINLMEIEISDPINIPDIKFFPGKYLELEIKDTGTGIDKNIIDKIFEPYFTTKEVGKGTGMGLAMIDGIIKAHNGFIKVFSEPGRGTVFQIFWPVIDPDNSRSDQ